MIERDDRDGIAVLRMAHGKASALDTEFLEALTDAFAGLSGERAVVLTGTGKIFSAGVDLYRLMDGGDAYLEAFLPALTRCLRALVVCPLPVVGACNGHAIAGGCILMAACDRRLMAEGTARIGAPELLVGVPFPLLPLELLRGVVAPQHLNEVALGGGTFEPADALCKGLIDEIVPADGLLTRAVELAAEMAAVPAVAFAQTKRLIRDPLIRRLDQHGPASDALTFEAWSSEPVRNAIAAYVEKTLGKR